MYGVAVARKTTRRVSRRVPFARQYRTLSTLTKRSIAHPRSIEETDCSSVTGAPTASRATEAAASPNPQASSTYRSQG